MLGTVCSTWVSVNAGTSGRSYVTPAGNMEYASVAAANCMVARRPVLKQLFLNLCYAVCSYRKAHEDCTKTYLSLRLKDQPAQDAYRLHERRFRT